MIPRGPILHAVAQIRTGPLAAVPIPVRLPYGGWFLTYGDEIGVTVLSQSFGLTQDYEVGEYRFVARFVKPGMTCIDVGANQGIYTILLCNRTKPTGRVIAFEPTPSVRRRLRRNLALNRCANAVVEPYALAEEDGSAEFYVSLEGKESYSGLKPAAIRAKVATLQVPVVKLDSYIRRQELTKTDFVKIDAEGAELQILHGSEELLTHHRPVILCEVADVRTQSFGYPAREIVRFLRERSYALFKPTNRGGLVPATERTSYAPDWENLVAVAAERESDVAALLE